MAKNPAFMTVQRRRVQGKIGDIAFSIGQRSFLKRSQADADQLGEKLALLFYRLSKKHRKRTLNNLTLAFPEWEEAQKEQVAEGVFKHFGRVAADFMRSIERSNEEVLKNVEFSGLHYFDEALSLGKGILGVTGHYGNWERLAHVMSVKGYKIAVVARDANNSVMNQRLLKIRQNAGVEVISRGTAIRPVLAKLRENGIIGLLPDQNCSESFVPFFGKPCGTVLGPGVLHLRTGAPIVGMFCTHMGDGHYLIEACPPIYMSEDKRTPEDIMTEVNAMLESIIRKHPEQWLWMHDRWKSARQRGLI